MWDVAIMCMPMRLRIDCTSSFVADGAVNQFTYVEIWFRILWANNMNRFHMWSMRNRGALRTNGVRLLTQPGIWKISKIYIMCSQSELRYPNRWAPICDKIYDRYNKSKLSCTSKLMVANTRINMWQNTSQCFKCAVCIPCLLRSPFGQRFCVHSYPFYCETWESFCDVLSDLIISI